MNKSVDKNMVTDDKTVNKNGIGATAGQHWMQQINNEQ